MPGARGRVAVVTDSTAYLPPDLVEAYGLTVVPLQVVVGGPFARRGRGGDQRRGGRGTARVAAGDDVPAVAADLRRHLPPARGAGGRVGAPLGRPLRDRGRRPRRRPAGGRGRDHVRRRRLAVAGHGPRVHRARRRARGRRGADAEAAARAARRYATEVGIYLYVDTLEYLRRGGRVGRRPPMVGSRSVGEAAAAPRRRPARAASSGCGRRAGRWRASRSWPSARPATAAGGRGRAAPGRRRARPGDGRPAAAHGCRARSLYVGEVGAVVGAHVGPGMLGVVVAPGGLRLRGGD